MNRNERIKLKFQMLLAILLAIWGTIIVMYVLDWAGIVQIADTTENVGVEGIMEEVEISTDVSYESIDGMMPYGN